MQQGMGWGTGEGDGVTGDGGGGHLQWCSSTCTASYFVRSLCDSVANIYV